MNLSDEEMWRAVIACDVSYDERFFYAVQSTGIFCRPSCKSKPPVRRNVCYFMDAKAALESGFRPCKRCRPEVASTISENEQIVVKAEEFLHQNYAQSIPLDTLAQHVGMSKYHFSRLFKQITGLSAREYLEDIRMERAKEFLICSDLNVEEISYRIGYHSLSRFYTVFTKKEGYTPSEFREKRKGETK
jgi:AraC family transcriptional regulator of adaptative response / methylphosphotriester-DNA alkyltransferase methyltransferase